MDSAFSNLEALEHEEDGEYAQAGVHLARPAVRDVVAQTRLESSKIETHSIELSPKSVWSFGVDSVWSFAGEVENSEHEEKKDRS